MYPKNNDSPPPVPIGAVIQISDGAVQSSGVTVNITTSDDANTAGGGSVSFVNGVVHYTPTKAETNHDWFALTAFKTGCIPSGILVVPTNSATAGTVDTVKIAGVAQTASDIIANQVVSAAALFPTLTVSGTGWVGGAWPVAGTYVFYGNQNGLLCWKSTTQPLYVWMKSTSMQFFLGGVVAAPANSFYNETVGAIAGSYTASGIVSGTCTVAINAMPVDLQTIKTQTVTCAAPVTVGAFVGNAMAAIDVDASGKLGLTATERAQVAARTLDTRWLTYGTEKPTTFSQADGTTIIYGDLATFAVDPAALTYLDCIGQTLTAIDVRYCTALTQLHCDENALTALDVSNCTLLTLLYCDNNSITSLDLANCTVLVGAKVSSNALTSLTLPASATLELLHCNGNQLTSLDISGCAAALTDLDAGVNRLSTAAVNSILAALVAAGLSGGQSVTTGQTPAAPPSGQGIIDAATLGTRGWSVLTD